MLVHDDVGPLRYLDGPIRQLLHCTALYELSKNFGGILIILGMFLSSRKLDLQVLNLYPVILFHLLNHKVLITDILKLNLSPTTL